MINYVKDKEQMCNTQHRGSLAERIIFCFSKGILVFFLYTVHLHNI